MAIEQFGKITYNDINNLNNESITTKSLTVNGDINCTGYLTSKFSQEGLIHTKKPLLTFVTPTDGINIYKFATLSVDSINHPVSIGFSFLGLGLRYDQIFASINSQGTSLEHFYRKSLLSSNINAVYYYKYAGNRTFYFYIEFQGWKRCALTDIILDFDTSESYDTHYSLKSEYIGNTVPSDCVAVTVLS